MKFMLNMKLSMRSIENFNCTKQEYYWWYQIKIIKIEWKNNIIEYFVRLICIYLIFQALINVSEFLTGFGILNSQRYFDN